MKKVLFYFLVILMTIGFIATWAFIPYPDNLPPIIEHLVFIIYSVFSILIWVVLFLRLKSKLQ